MNCIFLVIKRKNNKILYSFQNVKDAEKYVKESGILCDIEMVRFQPPVSITIQELIDNKELPE
jgi:hypothetical protein